MIVPSMASYCEFYFYDQSEMNTRAYYKYCSDGCCSNYCCYYHRTDIDSSSYTPVGAIVGITVGCLVGLGISIAFCVCVFKLCCKSEAAQAGQIIRQPGQQVTYVQSHTASGNSYGQQLNMAYDYHGQKLEDFGPPPAYEESVSYSSPSNPSYNNPGNAVSTDDTGIEQNLHARQIATVSDNHNMTSSSSVPHITQLTIQTDAVSTEQSGHFSNIASVSDNNMTSSSSAPHVTQMTCQTDTVTTNYASTEQGVHFSDITSVSDNNKTSTLEVT